MARSIFARVSPLGAGLVLVGVFVRPVSAAGAVLLALVCGYYPVGLAAPGRRDGAGVAAFALFGAWAVGLLATRLLR